MADRQQFDEFIDTHLDRAYGFARVYVKDTHDAEEVLQDSIEKALKKIHTLKDPTMMKQWFFKIIMNTALEYIRDQPKPVLMKTGLSQRFYIEDFSQIELEEILDMIPEQDRRIVYLRFVDERELSEIAEILGMNENTVKTKLYRTLKKLKLKINEDGEILTIKNKKVVKNITLGIVAVFLSAACIFNLSPALAVAAYDVPVIGGIVRVITFNRFEYKISGYGAEILVPEIQGLLDSELQSRLNSEFSENADDLIRSFEASILEADEFGVESARMSIKADYEVKTDNDKVLALDTYLYSDIGNYVVHKFYTIEKQTGALIALSGLFQPDVDYITPISDYIVSEMERINKDEGGAFEVGDSPFNTFTKIRPDHSFYINEDGKLVICFDKYEVAAGFMGSPEFIIPSEVVNDIVISDLFR